jgi:DNA-binding transcriptional regulator WhiA
MALTASVKDELSRLDIKKSSVRKAEVSAMLRFAGGLHIISDESSLKLKSTLPPPHVVFEQQSQKSTDTRAKSLWCPAAACVGGAATWSGWCGTARPLAPSDRVARWARTPCSGLPSVVVNGSAADAEAVWRGAFLAHGSLTEPGRSSSLEVTCPGPESALALVGAARRLGIQAKAREVRGVGPCGHS